jgi:hypothetical protein
VCILFACIVGKGSLTYVMTLDSCPIFLLLYVYVDVMVVYSCLVLCALYCRFLSCLALYCIFLYCS